MRHLGRNAVLVIAVLLISLASIYPPEKKLRLGKDLQGGFNVVYQVDVGADFSSRDATLDKVIQVIKDRLDPNGLLDISIVKAGSDRIEIAMPLPGEESKKLHAAFDAEMDKLVTVALDKAALDRALQTPAGEREKELERLSHGSADRLARFRAAAEAYDAYRAADAAYQEAAKKMTELQANLRQAKAKAAELGEDYIKLIEDGIKAQEQIATPLADAANASEENYKAKAQAVLSTVITRDEVEHALTRRSGVIRVPNPDDPKAPIVLPSPREKAIAELLARHPEAADQIKVVAAAWETIEKNVQINDPNDLIRLLEGSGVLNFRITVNPNELGAEERELRQQFRTLGPLNARTDQARWFKINKIENWFKTKAQYDELQADPAAYLQRSHGLVSEPFEGDYYILCWDKRGYRLTERDGSNWELRSAFPSTDRIGRKCIAFTMDAVGAKLLGDLTGNNVGRQMAVILDDQVYTAPSINSQISSSGVIEGSFTDQEINYITRVLSHGSLSAKLSKKPISQEIIAPELGADNLRSSLITGIVASVLVAGFMVAYYFGSGMIAVVGLVYNFVLVVAIMALNNTAFSLPAIAGIVLTFGQAVDSNVLVYERMREEFHRGADMRTALRLGFSRALPPIVDGNVSNLIICVVLGSFGTQEIRGFAITLGIGVVTTLFSTLVLSRLLFTVLVERFHWKKASQLPMVLPFVQRLMTPHFDWMKHRHLLLGVLVAFLLASAGIIVQRGSELMGMEFRGGTKVTIQLKETEPGKRLTASRAQIQDTLKKAAEASNDPVLNALQAADIVVVNPEGDGVTSSQFSFRTVLTDAKTVQAALIKTFGSIIDAQPQLTFDGSGITDPKAAPVFPILDPSLGANIGRPEITLDDRDFIGGAAIVLDNIQPPVSIASINARLDQLRSQSDFHDVASHEQRVVSLAGDEKAATSVAILVKDPTTAFQADVHRWESAVRDREWHLVHTALTDITTLAGVQSFSPAIAQTFTADGIVCAVLSLVLLTIYVFARFGTVRWAVAATVPLFADVVGIVGLIGVAQLLYDSHSTHVMARSLGLLPFDLDLAQIAAILTIVGYSLNDKIIILDRIRENKGKRAYASYSVINDSINQTLSRTVITAGVHMITTIVLYLFGGEAIRGFAYTFNLGVLLGTYTSIVSTPLVWSGKFDKSDKAPGAGALAVKEAVENTNAPGVPEPIH